MRRYLLFTLIVGVVFSFILLHFSFAAQNNSLRVPVQGSSVSKRIISEEQIDEINRLGLHIDPSILALKELKKEPLQIDHEKVVEKAICALEVQIANGVKVPWLHYDIIGGSSSIVKSPNPEITMDKLKPKLLGEIKAAARKKNIDFYADVHLMVEEVDEGLIGEYISEGADYITLHYEGYIDKNALKDRILFINDSDKCKAGLAFNPDIDIETIIDFVSKNELRNHIYLFLQMTVYPGEGAQKFMKEVLPNITKLKNKFGSSVLLQVDGGINGDTIGEAVKAGANLFVSGSSFFGKEGQAFSEVESNLINIFSGIPSSIPNISVLSRDNM